MKYLKIDNNQGFFIKDKTQPNIWTEIDKIEKDDLLNLLEFIIDDDSFEMDIYNPELLGNKAHQIIYESIFEKLNSFLTNRDRFKDQTDNIYKDELEKYQ